MKLAGYERGYKGRNARPLNVGIPQLSVPNPLLLPGGTCNCIVIELSCYFLILLEDLRALCGQRC